MRTFPPAPRKPRRTVGIPAPAPRARLAGSPAVGLLALALAAAVATSTTAGGDPAAGDRAAPGDASPAAASLVPITAPLLLERVRAAEGKAVLVNIWATWCLPCREEFPDLLRLREEYRSKGLRLFLVSGDFEGQEEQVNGFLAEHGVDFTTFMKTGKDMEFIDALSPEWSGALPATFVFDGGGALRYFWEGKASYETFEEKVVDVLGAGAPAGTGREE